MRVLCTSCDDVFICTKFLQNILNGFGAMERSRFVTGRHTDGTTMEKTIYLTRMGRDIKQNVSPEQAGSGGVGGEREREGIA